MKFEEFGINLAKARMRKGLSAYELSLQSKTQVILTK